LLLFQIFMKILLFLVEFAFVEDLCFTLYLYYYSYLKNICFYYYLIKIKYHKVSFIIYIHSTHYIHYVSFNTQDNLSLSTLHSTDIALTNAFVYYFWRVYIFFLYYLHNISNFASQSLGRLFYVFLRVSPIYLTL
jgi:hypothetical protein